MGSVSLTKQLQDQLDKCWSEVAATSGYIYMMATEQVYGQGEHTKSFILIEEIRVQQI